MCSCCVQLAIEHCVHTCTTVSGGGAVLRATHFSAHSSGLGSHVLINVELCSPSTALKSVQIIAYHCVSTLVHSVSVPVLILYQYGCAVCWVMFCFVLCLTRHPVQQTLFSLTDPLSSSLALSL